MALARYLSAIVLGIAAAMSAWAVVVGMHPMLTQVSVVGLVPGFVAGLAGGFVASWLAPRHKLAVSVALGLLTAAYLVESIFSRGATHGTHNPLLWYWPIWLIPTFLIGGLLSRNLWLPPNKSPERTREG